jgi:hypothetical protein
MSGHHLRTCSHAFTGIDRQFEPVFSINPIATEVPIIGWRPPFILRSAGLAMSRQDIAARIDHKLRVHRWPIGRGGGVFWCLAAAN